MSTNHRSSFDRRLKLHVVYRLDVIDAISSVLAYLENIKNTRLLYEEQRCVLYTFEKELEKLQFQRRSQINISFPDLWLPQGVKN